MTIHTPAYTPAQRVRILLIGLGAPLLIAGVGIAVMLSWTDLPDPIAVHWSAADGPDGFGPVAGIAWLLAVITLVFGAFASITTVTMRASSVRSSVPRFLIATSVWLGVFLTVGIGGTVAMQRGLADAADSGSPIGAVLFGLLVALLPAAAAWFATPRPLIEALPEEAPPTLDLGVGERAIWVRSVRPGGVFIAVLASAVALVIGGATLALLVGGIQSLALVIAPAIILAIALSTMFWRVRVDANGVVARAAIGFPGFRIPLDEIASARVVRVESLQEFGGWGVRFANRRVGIILRPGESLQVERRDGRQLVVTVDDATTAAALLNGLIARSTAAR